ncbi:MAG TPA: Na(+)-translocating NADH-quinone reductase subunit C [Nitrospiraceae bacterium]|nr:Na(+)-translocating NADH-quinone reductase subunit C [Nitrospiraceae bacterium]
MSAPEPDSAVPPASGESASRTLLVTFVVCLACSVVVAGAAVLLRPIQETNQKADLIRNVVAVSGLLKEGLTEEQALKRIDARMVELATGDEVEGIDPDTFNIAKAGKDPAISTELARREDVAQIRREPRYLPVYRIVGENGGLKKLILPVYGYGLWSTLYGFLALEEDLRTVQGLRFYQHAETPGLGGEIDNPKWRTQWTGKVLFDEQWKVQVEVTKAAIDSSSPDAQHQVDALAGATITSRGVENLLKFWLSDKGYGPYLARLRDERS